MSVQVSRPRSIRDFIDDRAGLRGIVLRRAAADIAAAQRERCPSGEVLERLEKLHAQLELARLRELHNWRHLSEAPRQGAPLRGLGSPVALRTDSPVHQARILPDGTVLTAEANGSLVLWSHEAGQGWAGAVLIQRQKGVPAFDFDPVLGLVVAMDKNEVATLTRESGSVWKASSVACASGDPLLVQWLPSGGVLVTTHFKVEEHVRDVRGLWQLQDRQSCFEVREVDVMAAGWRVIAGATSIAIYHPEWPRMAADRQVIWTSCPINFRSQIAALSVLAGREIALGCSRGDLWVLKPHPERPWRSALVSLGSVPCVSIQSVAGGGFCVLDQDGQLQVFSRCPSLAAGPAKDRVGHESLASQDPGWRQAEALPAGRFEDLVGIRNARVVCGYLHSSGTVLLAGRREGGGFVGLVPLACVH